MLMESHKLCVSHTFFQCLNCHLSKVLNTEPSKIDFNYFAFVRFHLTFKHVLYLYYDISVFPMRWITKTLCPSAPAQVPSVTF